MQLSSEEIKYYDRHIKLNEIGLKGQEKLKAAKILVVGAGGLGAPILQYLAAAGIGNITVVDGDKVEVSNLHRQVLFTTDDVGKFKAEVAVNRLKKQNPFVNFTVVTQYLDRLNVLELLKMVDIVVDGSDNFATRYLINDACVLLNKTLVYGAIHKFEGQVSVFNYQNGPTYRCLFPTPPAPEEMPNCSDIGVLGILPGLIGTLQATEVIKIILELGEILSGKLLQYNTLSMKQTVLGFGKTEAAKVTDLLTDYHLFCGELNLEIEDDYNEISYETYLEDESDFELLDVRTTAEHQANNIGGINIWVNELASKMSTLPTGKPLLVYCSSGKRSKKAISILRTNGYQNEIFNLEDGIR